MKLGLLLLPFIVLACKSRPSSPAIVRVADSSSVYDTLRLINRDSIAFRDSVEQIRLLDSFHAVRPLAVYRWEGGHDPFYKMINYLIDTHAIVRSQLQFTDTTIYKYNKRQMPVSCRWLYKSKGLSVEVRNPDFEHYSSPFSFWVNGRELRAGKELDTALSGSGFLNVLELADWNCWKLRFGNRQLLLLTGGIERCTGIACGVSYYIVYDVFRQKGFVLNQFRSEFIAGANPRTGDLVFLEMADRKVFNSFYQGFFESGRAYIFDRQNRLRPYLDGHGEQYHFDAFFHGESDSLLLLNGNIPLRGQ